MAKINSNKIASGAIRDIKIWDIVQGCCLLTIENAHLNKIRRLAYL